MAGGDGDAEEVEVEGEKLEKWFCCLLRAIVFCTLRKIFYCSFFLSHSFSGVFRLTVTVWLCWKN